MKADKPLFEPTCVTDNNYDVVGALPISNLTVRDLAMLMAMQGFLSNPTVNFKEEGFPQILAKDARTIADALIAESEKK